MSARANLRQRSACYNVMYAEPVLPKQQVYAGELCISNPNSSPILFPFAYMNEKKMARDLNHLTADGPLKPV